MRCVLFIEWLNFPFFPSSSLSETFFSTWTSPQRVFVPLGSGPVKVCDYVFKDETLKVIAFRTYQLMNFLFANIQMALTWTILTSRFPSLTGPRSGRDQTFILYSGNVKILKEKGKPTALFFSIFSPTFALMPRVNANVFGPRQPLWALIINILWNHMPNYFVFKQESKERIAELLGIEPKEEDFECIEDFPGKLHIL